MSHTEAAKFSPVRMLLAVLLCLVAALLFGKAFVTNFRLPDNVFNDFVQEWLSAKNYFAGKPVYVLQKESLKWHMPEVTYVHPNFLKWNAHPPGSVLVALPFALLPFQTAAMVWNLVNFLLFVAVLVLAIRSFRLTLAPQTIVFLIGLLVACHPLHGQIALAQFNFLLFALITGCWICERREAPISAGLLLGIATGIKLFPGFLILYFLATRRWSAVIAWLIATLAVNGLAMALFGVEAFRTYVEQVIPSVSLYYQTDWRNISLPGYFRRLFDPGVGFPYVPLVRSPLMESVATNLCRGVVGIVCAWYAFSAKNADQKIRAFVLCAFGMLLVSPICWTHYLVAVGMPLLQLWQRLQGAVLRSLFYLALFTLWLPENLIPTLHFGGEAMKKINSYEPFTVSTFENLAYLSPLNYATLGMFLLALFLPGEGCDLRGDTNEATAANLSLRIEPTPPGS